MKPKNDRIEFHCPDCPYKTKSEVQFAQHLEREHAARPDQIGRIVAKQSNKETK